MRIAVISDIHSNLAALEAVLSDIEREAADMIVCLGDIVGYGARPNACVRLVKSREITCILGNHDEAVFTRGCDKYFNAPALEAIIWTRNKLHPENTHFLTNLPISFESQDSLYVHASPSDPASWSYITSSLDASREFEAFPHRICFVGHTHVPRIFTSDTAPMKMIVNVGSVGQPRDNDPRACWTLYDSTNAKIEFHRVDYPIRITAEEILTVGLPTMLANRLFHGF